ncbi:MAG: hypothetical protein P4K97_06210 [Terracidiphilus sp.]|nr:hypothetical protein [Terracidiphilus sp.]
MNQRVPTGRENRVWILSQGCDALHPGLFSRLPYGKTAVDSQNGGICSKEKGRITDQNVEKNKAGAEQAAEKRRDLGEIGRKHPAGAEARDDLTAVTARLKSCLLQNMSPSVVNEVYPQHVNPPAPFVSED